MAQPQQPELARSGHNAVDPPPPDERPLRETGKGPLRSVPEDNRPGHHPDVEQDKPTGPPSTARDRTQRRHFAFAFEPLLVPGSIAFGVTPWTSGVDVDADELRVRFGPWVLRAPLDSIAGAEVTGPYNLVKVAGPPRLSFADRGITFATNRQRGVCIRFRDPVPGIDPWGRIRHPAATVTVEDPESLARVLNAG